MTNSPIFSQEVPLKARFVSSAPTLKGCPKPVYPEYAFIGRSNVGKSSLINMLTGHKELARTSSQPGKTRLINHFLIEESWYLADLPGYGYARVSKSIREQWPEMVKDYLISRANLLDTFVLIDLRHEPQNNDLDFIRWMGSESLPFCLVFTKSDKLSRDKRAAAVDSYKMFLLNEWEELPPTITTSSVTKAGREEILQVISEANKLFENLTQPGL